MQETQIPSWVGKIPWSWLLTPLFLPGEFHEQRSLAGYSPWSHKELDTAEWLTLHFQSSVPFFLLTLKPVHTCLSLQAVMEITTVRITETHWGNGMLNSQFVSCLSFQWRLTELIIPLPLKQFLHLDFLLLLVFCFVVTFLSDPSTETSLSVQPLDVGQWKVFYFLQHTLSISFRFMALNTIVLAKPNQNTETYRNLNRRNLLGITIVYSNIICLLRGKEN